MIKPITQKHPMGCAVACVAAILGSRYNKALRLFDQPEQAWTEGYFCRDIVVALKKAKKDYHYQHLKNPRDPLLKIPGTIVFTRYSKAYPRGHYLVRTSKGWMNPWVNYPEIAPAKSAFVTKLPAKPTYAVFAVESLKTSI